MNELYQELFEHMSNEHNVDLLESEIQEIISIVDRINTEESEKSNGEKKCPTCEFLGDIAPCDKCFNKIGL